MTPLVSRNSCPVCGSQAFRTLFSESYASDFLRNYLSSSFKDRGKSDLSLLSADDFVICVCNQCNLIFQKNIPGPQLSESLYTCWIDGTKLFEHKVRNRKIAYYKYLSKTVEKLIRQFRKPPSQLTVYDFGMGWGDFCHMAQAYGCEVWGSELAPEQIRYAESFGIKNIQLQDIPAEEFDIVNINQVLEHLDEPVTYLREIARSLSPTGILRFAVPNGNILSQKLNNKTTASFQVDLAPHLKLLAPLEHINCFTTTSVDAMLELANLTPVRLKRASIFDLTLRDIKQKLIWTQPSSLEVFCTKSKHS